MLLPAEVDKIKEAIKEANSVNDIERLESALREGTLERVRDLLPVTRSTGSLEGLWDAKSSEPIHKPEAQMRVPARVPVSRKTARQEIEEEQAKRRYTEAIQLVDTVLTKILPMMAPVKINPSNGWKSAPVHTEGKKKILSIDCGTAVCLTGGEYVSDVIVRVVVTDFLTDRTIIDLKIQVPEGFEPVDLRPSLTGIAEYSPVSAVSLAAAVSKLFEFVSEDTVLISYNPYKCANGLQFNHKKWISIPQLLVVDQTKKKRAEGKFHVRSVLTPSQYMEAFLGESVSDRLKHIPVQERMVETNLGLIRILKGIARRNVSALPIMIDPPRRLHTIFLCHISSSWGKEEIRTVLPTAVDVEPIEYFIDTSENEWRGECQVTFKSQLDVEAAFSKLTTCTDVFVGWEWPSCGKVTEQSLRELGSDFGSVVGVRIQDKYLNAPDVVPGKEESRPFGFISMARYPDALAMAGEPRQIVKNDLSFHVKISKKPITAFKRIPLGEGEDYLEGFIM
jgi:hypothetical protein